jgi:hypothetical protein
MEVASIKASVSAKTTLRIDFSGLVFPVTPVTFTVEIARKSRMYGMDIDDAPELQTRT